MAGAFAKTKKAINILRPAVEVTFDKDAEFEVFSEVGVQEHSPSTDLQKKYPLMADGSFTLI